MNSAHGYWRSDNGRIDRLTGRARRLFFFLLWASQGSVSVMDRVYYTEVFAISSLQISHLASPPPLIASVSTRRRYWSSSLFILYVRLRSSSCSHPGSVLSRSARSCMIRTENPMERQLSTSTVPVMLHQLCKSSMAFHSMVCTGSIAPYPDHGSSRFVQRSMEHDD